MVDLLVAQIQHPQNAVCADFGSGTGIFSKSLVGHFKTVYGIEPNPDMRNAGELYLRDSSNFVSVNGTAEQSGLETCSVDVITAAQAFHWFDPQKFKDECRRILRPKGAVALIWNNRQANTEFLKRYDELLKQHANDYNSVNHQNISEQQRSEFFEGGYQVYRFKNVQRFDRVGLLGRLDSSSYAPKPGTAAFKVLRQELTQAFEDFNDDGLIHFNYETELYFGELE